MAGQIDWVKALYGPRWTAILTRLAATRYGQMTDAVQLMEDARQQLALSLDRRQKSADAGLSLSSAYIMTAFNNAMIDLHRQRSGRPEPRAWLKAFGKLGLWLYALYCLEGLGRREVLVQIQADSDQDSVEEHKLRAVLDEMDRRRECDGAGRREQPLEDERGKPLDISSGHTPEQQLMREQGLAIQARLFLQSSADFSSAQGLMSRMQGLQSGQENALALDDEQRFILQATLAGDLTEERMGELLGGLSVRQVRYRRQQALEKLGQWIRAAGLSLEDLLPDEEKAA